MKKLLIAISLPLLALVACNSNKSPQADTAALKEQQLTERLEMAQDSKDSLIFLMSDIYSGIEEINVQEGLLYNLRGTENSDQKAEILDNLNRIRTELQDKQARLDQLTSQFNASNDKNGQLVKEVANLKAMIAQKEAKIGELQNQLESAHQEISSLNEQVATTQEQVKQEAAAKEAAQTEAADQKVENEKLVNQSNTVYYAIGTKKELKAHNIEPNNKKALTGNFDQSYFTTADRRSLTVIPCRKKKIEVLTPQPKDSYRIEQDAQGLKSVVITNPARFWSTSPYLVIKVD